MSNMISIASGFQSSVNIEYDLNNDEKLKHYIPTKAAMSLLEEILLSTNKDSTDRARILIGAYGKGKSHIVLMILSILMQKPLDEFEKLLPVLEKSYPEIYQLVINYKSSGKKFLPVIISGSGSSISQSFMFALEHTLKVNELTDIMPDTNYKAAVDTIQRWKAEYPDTFSKFESLIDGSADNFCDRLKDFDNEAYENFESIYPLLTSGGVFNPFIGMDVVSLYDAVTKSLKQRGFSGIYVIYDEFSKYLEDKIADTTKGDTKALQDFAEKCARSGENQLHIMLISHKEITSYIGKADKSVVDGWRGVSERFHHIYLNNNFTQTYEIIASAIEKDNALWNEFKEKHSKDFDALYTRYEKHPVFSDTEKDDIDRVICECYPLHPITTFILPRLSERIAQNERTLFTFLSAAGNATLSSWLEEHDECNFMLATPDLIYDYFEPLMRQEVYSGSLHKTYVLTATVLRSVEDGSIQSKIIKTISLIYILEQFEKLQPTIDELIGIFGQYAPEDVKAAINELIDKKYIVYLKRSNNYLRLKETSGIDIHEEIEKKLAGSSTDNTRKTLNDYNIDNYMYPSRYNDETCMTRYFAFKFINEDEIKEDTDWNKKSQDLNSDGVIYAVIPNKEAMISSLEEKVIRSSENYNKCIFVIPKKKADMSQIIAEFNAVCSLREHSDDPVIFADYDVVYEDLRDVITKYIREYTRPEQQKAVFIHSGMKLNITRKAALTELMSSICDKAYGNTPIVNNEMLNLEVPSAVTVTSRGKIVTALLQNDIEEDLGLKGSRQEVSLMRSSLIIPGILKDSGEHSILDLEPDDEKFKYMFRVLTDFINKAKRNGTAEFSDLYEDLTTDKLGIGLRRGVIPIYLACACHSFKKEIVIFNGDNQEPLTNDTLTQINSNPKQFRLGYLDWNADREEYVKALEKLFDENITAVDSGVNNYDHIAIAIRKWYLALPKYSKNIKSERGRKFLRELKGSTGSYELLFKKIPMVFGYEEADPVILKELSSVKAEYDSALMQLKKDQINIAKEIFSEKKDTAVYKKMSLFSIVLDWIDTLPSTVFEQLFTDGTDKCLALFKSVNNNDIETIEALGKIATDLRMEDWDADVIDAFKEQLIIYKETAESFVENSASEITEESINCTSDYQLVFPDEDGHFVTKRFNRTEETKRGQLLHNAITSQIKAMGQAISEQEKRQILMDILKDLC